MNRKVSFFKRIWFFRLVANMLIIIAFLAWLEFSLRAVSISAPLSPFQPHPDLFWVLSPNLTNFTYTSGKITTVIDTNSSGMRSEEVDVARSERSFRIVCLGDESTLGTGIAQDMTYPKLLQKAIRKRFHFFVTDVFNAGVEGYTSYQGLIFFKKYCIGHFPHIF